jgi:hypothetical protein
MAVSDSPIQIDKDRWRRTLLNYRLEGTPIFNMALESDRELLDKVLRIAGTLPGDTYDVKGMESRDNVIRRTEGKSIVTDDNMAVEWRGYDWRHSTN